MVIASPTTGTETTDALTIFNLTQKSQKPQIFLFEATIFREFREFCVTFLLSHTHLSSLTTNLTNPHESFILVPNTPIRVDSSDSWSKNKIHEKFVVNS